MNNSSRRRRRNSRRRNSSSIGGMHAYINNNITTCDPSTAVAIATDSAFDMANMNAFLRNC